MPRFLWVVAGGGLPFSHFLRTGVHYSGATTCQIGRYAPHVAAILAKLKDTAGKISQGKTSSRRGGRRVIHTVMSILEGVFRFGVRGTLEQEMDGTYFHPRLT